MNKHHRIGIVDDEPAQRQLLENALQHAGYSTVSAEDGEGALGLADELDAMLLDVRMPGLSGLDVLARLRTSHPNLPVILLTAFIDVRDAVAVIKQGAVDYLEKPVDLDELIAVVDDTMGIAGRGVSEGLPLPEGIVAEAPALREVLRLAGRAAQTETTVLLNGESGTGKEVVARYIHACSLRAVKPFVTVDCTTLSRELAESELFGHARGAFTGAHDEHAGHFEVADHGTVFLDEIGDLSLALQPKLLRVLEAGKTRRVGETKERAVDVRIIAASHRTLEEEVRAGRFREDLFYRLNVFPLTVPPLRERREDVLPLAEAILKRSRKTLSPAAERLLMNYDWPGNVRELRNALERATILASGRQILPTDLPTTLREAPTDSPTNDPLAGEMREIEKRAILAAIEKTGGNKSQAAELLGISRRNLIYKLRAYGL